MLSKVLFDVDMFSIEYFVMMMVKSASEENFGQFLNKTKANLRNLGR